MANGRNQGQSGGTERGSQSQRGLDSGTSDDEMELEGTTEEGLEVSASMDDDTSLDDSDGASEGSDSRGLRGGSGNFANDPERASEAGRKGGKH